MLVLSRKTGQSIEIGNGIIVTVTQIKGKQVRIGIEAPAEVPIRREEIAEPKSKTNTRLSAGRLNENAEPSRVPNILTQEVSDVTNDYGMNTN